MTAGEVSFVEQQAFVGGFEDSFVEQLQAFVAGFEDSFAEQLQAFLAGFDDSFARSSTKPLWLASFVEQANVVSCVEPVEKTNLGG